MVRGYLLVPIGKGSTTNAATDATAQPNGTRRCFRYQTFQVQKSRTEIRTQATGIRIQCRNH